MKKLEAMKLVCKIYEHEKMHETHNLAKSRILETPS
jgi:hypothetical protein